MKSFVNLNGALEQEDQPLITVNNRGFRYGDGLFETMKWVNGKIPLEKYHFERLFSGMSALAFTIPDELSPKRINEQISQLLEKNAHEKKARIRLTIFRKSGALHDGECSQPDYIIQSAALPDETGLNAKGLHIDIYPAARKSQDIFSSLKTNNFLPYVMGAIYAKAHQLDDCILLNTGERICDATIANVFIIKDATLVTPPVSEGCIAGVMRRYLLETLAAAGYPVNEQPVTMNQLAVADEVFLTNAVSGIRWVEKCGNVCYTNRITAEIFERLVKGLL